MLHLYSLSTVSTLHLRHLCHTLSCARRSWRYFLPFPRRSPPFLILCHSLAISRHSIAVSRHSPSFIYWSLDVSHFLPAFSRRLFTLSRHSLVIFRRSAAVLFPWFRSRLLLIRPWELCRIELRPSTAAAAARNYHPRTCHPTVLEPHEPVIQRSSNCSHRRSTPTTSLQVDRS